jgi:hypothetical protein
MLSDAVKLDAANTAYLAAAESVFSKDMPGEFGMFTEQTDDHENNLAEWVDAGVTPQMKRWNGSKPHGGFRVFKQTARIEPFSAGIELKRRDVLRDKSGVVNRRINTFLTNTASELNRQAWETLLGNPTGIDEDPLLSSSHPYGFEGDWDNTSSAALSHGAYNTAKAAMRAQRHENGKYFGVKPTHLFVGPAKERLAQDIVGPNRVVAVNTAGAEAGSGSVAAGTIDNAYVGDVTVVVVDHFADGTHDDDWLLMDLSPGIGRPMWLVLDRKPEGISLFSMDDPERYNRDVFQASVEGDWAFAGLYPHAIHGKLS